MYLVQGKIYKLRKKRAHRRRTEEEKEKENKCEYEYEIECKQIWMKGKKAHGTDVNIYTNCVTI